ncbi:MAG: carboxypeptidase regulatory-like domain-containing protein, partial [Myxococcota bacterium]
QTGAIRGTVVDESGQPVADAFVTATRESDSAAGSGQANRRARFGWGSWDNKPVLTDQDGNFEIGQLAEGGVYTIRANRKGGGDGLAEHVSAGSTVEVAIESVGSIAGVVTLAGGGYPERFEIRAENKKAGVSSGDSVFRTEGKFLLENLPAGEYEVLAGSSSGDAKTTVTLGEAEAKTGVKLQLVPRVTITGTLVDADTGEPVEGLKVRARGEGGGGSTFYFGGEERTDTPDISDASGRFELENAPTGKVNFTVMKQGSWMDDSEDSYGWNTFFRRVPSEPEVQDIGELELVKERMKNSETAGDLGFKFKEQEPGGEPEDVVLEVAVVRPGGPAAQAGLNVGDVVTSMEGKDVSGANSRRSWKLMRVPEGKTVKLGLKEGGEVTITAGPPV